MGEIADMMIDGDMDYITGEYLCNWSGFPRSNYDKDKPKKRKKKTKNRKVK